MDYYHLSVAVKNIQKSINLGYCYMYVIITEAFLNYDIAYGSLDRSSCWGTLLNEILLSVESSMINKENVISTIYRSCKIFIVEVNKKCKCQQFK